MAGFPDFNTQEQGINRELVRELGDLAIEKHSASGINVRGIRKTPVRSTLHRSNRKSACRHQFTKYIEPFAFSSLGGELATFPMFTMFTGIRRTHMPLHM